jgi:hypothetical protein
MELALTRIPSWIRWALTPISSPVAFALVGLAASIASRLYVFFQGDRPGWSLNFFDYLVVPAVAGYFAVYVAAVLAPKARPIVALTTACVWLMLCGFGAFFALANGEFKLLLPCIAIAGAATLATFAANELVNDVSSEALDAPKPTE